jgi:hypothetical protein
MATRPQLTSADRVAVSILALVALVVGITFRDYGLGWDDYTHSQYGNLLLKLYGSGFVDTRALSFVNLFNYGGGFDMAAALAAKLLPFGLFETRRLAGAIIGIVGLAATWRLGRRIGGPIAGVSALILLAACPLYYGHMFMNAKDAPFAATMAVLFLAVARSFDEYPKVTIRSVLLLGTALGVTFGSRILALVAVPIVALALLLFVVADAHATTPRAAAKRFGLFAARTWPALPLGYAIMAVLWPWSVISPLNPIRAAFYFSKFFERPWREIYEGVLYAVPDMPASYLPHLFMLKLPLLMLALGLGGAAGALSAAARSDVAPPRRAGLLMLVLASFLPIAIAMAMRPALYNGLRHFVFVTPPFAVLGGIAAAWAIDRARAYGRIALTALLALFAAGIADPVVSMVRLHPYQYVYFNPIVGGVRGAEGKYMLDYWGLAFKQAADELRARLAAGDVQPSKGRRWVVAICGPQAAAEQELGDEFETTFDQKTADFAMALGTFYCEHLQQPIIDEIRRDGVVFARVYDLRGWPTPKLLTLPPP